MLTRTAGIESAYAEFAVRRFLTDRASKLGVVRDVGPATGDLLVNTVNAAMQEAFDTMTDTGGPVSGPPGMQTTPVGPPSIGGTPSERERQKRAWCGWSARTATRSGRI